MVVVTGLQKVVKAFDNIKVLTSLSSQSHITVKITDDISFSWNEWNIHVKNVSFSLTLRKENIDIDVLQVISSYEIFIHKTDKPLAPLFLSNQKNISVINPIAYEFLDTAYRNMSYTCTGEIKIPDHISKQIMVSVATTITNFRKTCVAVGYDYSDGTISSLIQKMLESKETTEREWVIKIGGNMAIVVAAPTLAQAYARSITNENIVLEEGEFYMYLSTQTDKQPTEIDQTTLEFYLLDFLSREFPIYSI